MRTFPILAAALALLAACDSTDPTVPRGEMHRVVVLNGVGQTGVTLLSEAEPGSSVHIPFTSFDGAAMTVDGPWAFTTSSRASGDLLFIAQLDAHTRQTVTLPAASNPAGVVREGNVAGLRLFVALRDSAAIARVEVPANGPAEVVLMLGAGECPYDALVQPDAVWSLDANVDCRGFYEPFGVSRLIRLDRTGPARDTVDLQGAIGALRVFHTGSTTAHVFAPGNYFDVPATVTRVDLAARETNGQREIPGHYGVAATVGLDGRLYVVAAPYGGYLPAVFVVDPATLAIAGGSAQVLTASDGVTPVRCDAATGHFDGSILCVSNTNGFATLHAFALDGRERFRVQAGTAAFDIALRGDLGGIASRQHP